MRSRGRRCACDRTSAWRSATCRALPSRTHTPARAVRIGDSLLDGNDLTRCGNFDLADLAVALLAAKFKNLLAMYLDASSGLKLDIRQHLLRRVHWLRRSLGDGQGGSGKVGRRATAGQGRHDNSNAY